MSGNSSPSKRHVCLVTEGSYPYVIGGTGEWTQQLMETLPEIDFTVVAISAMWKDRSRKQYSLPSNVREVIDVVMQDNTNVSSSLRKPPSSLDKQSSWKRYGQIYRAMMRNDYSRFSELYALMRHELTGWDLFHSHEHWKLVEHYYRLLTPIEPFIDFYWVWRASHLMLYKLMQVEMPKADVYHPIASGYAGFMAVCGKQANGGSLVLTEHGLYTQERSLEIGASEWFRGYQKDFMSGFFDKINRLVYSQADRIISLYEQARSEQIRMGAPEEKTEVIPNGVDLDRLGAFPVRPQAEDIRISFVGRVVPIKDVIAFIEMAKVVAETVPQAVFQIVGPLSDDPSYARDCQALTRELGLQDRLKFTGFRMPEEFLPEMDILVLTSLKESQPLAALEAMACGIPVVAIRSGSLPEMLNQEACLVWPRDIQSTADAVIRLARDRNRRRQIGAGLRARAYERYDQQKNLKRYEKHYLELAHEKRNAKAR